MIVFALQLYAPTHCHRCGFPLATNPNWTRIAPAGHHPRCPWASRASAEPAVATNATQDVDIAWPDWDQATKSLVDAALDGSRAGPKITRPS